MSALALLGLRTGDSASEVVPVYIKSRSTRDQVVAGRCHCVPDGGAAAPKVELSAYRQHIDGGLTMIDVDTALINPGALPLSFLERLKAMKIRTVEVHHEDEFFTVNCVVVRPGRVIMSETSSRTLERLDKAGREVIPVAFEAVYRGGGGLLHGAPGARRAVAVNGP